MIGNWPSSSASGARTRGSWWDGAGFIGSKSKLSGAEVILACCICSAPNRKSSTPLWPQYWVCNVDINRSACITSLHIARVTLDSWCNATSRWGNWRKNWKMISSLADQGAWYHLHPGQTFIFSISCVWSLVVFFDSGGIIVNTVRQSNYAAEYFQQHPDPRGGRPTNCADKEWILGEYKYLTVRIQWSAKNTTWVCSH